MALDNRSRFGRVAGREAAHVDRLEPRQLFAVAGIPLKAHALPKGTNFPGNLTAMANGNVWFTCGLASEVGYVTPAGVAHTISTASASSHGIDALAVGPDGNVWFAEFWDNVVGEITPKGKVLTYGLGTTYGPQAMALGPDGHLWVGTFDGHIGRINGITGGTADVSWFKGTDSGPISQIVAWDGALYYRTADHIGDISTAGVFGTTDIVPPSAGDLADLTVGSDGNLWFTENHTGGQASVDHLGHITPTGAVSEVAVSTKLGDLSDASTGTKGATYFRQGDYLEKLSAQGKVVASQKLGLAAGGGAMVTTAKGVVWCAEGVLDRLVSAG